MENPRFRGVNDALKDAQLLWRGVGIPGRPSCLTAHPVPTSQWFSGSPSRDWDLGDIPGAWMLAQGSSVPSLRQSSPHFLFCLMWTGPPLCGLNELFLGPRHKGHEAPLSTAGVGMKPLSVPRAVLEDSRLFVPTMPAWHPLSQGAGRGHSATSRATCRVGGSSQEACPADTRPDVVRPGPRPRPFPPAAPLTSETYREKASFPLNEMN